MDEEEIPVTPDEPVIEDGDGTEVTEPEIPEVTEPTEPEIPTEPEVPELSEEEQIIADKISIIALMIGDIEGGPYYPMFTPEQYAKFLKAAKGNLNRAAVLAAISSGYMVSGESSREVLGELQISSSTASNYLKLLDYLIATAGKVPPDNLMPWFAGADECDKNKLLQFELCDPRHGRSFGDICQRGC
jgi:hypothetical protein